MLTIIAKIFRDKNVQSLSGNTINAALGFVSFILLTRSYEKEIFGQWVLYITGSVFIEMFRFGLTKTAIVRFLSGAGAEEQKKLKGTNYVTGLFITAIIAVLLFSASLLFPSAIESSGYKLFFTWYPLMAFLNFPYNNAITLLQARQRFDLILLLKASNIGCFVIFLALNLFFFKLDILSVVAVHLLLHFVFSLAAFFSGWDGHQHISSANIGSAKKILNFGKYATGTLISSNLLKSADTFIIALSPVLGAAGVATYSVPLKLTEVLAMPLKSLSATAFPKMSKAAMQNKLHEVQRLFYVYSGALTFFFVALATGGFIFARELVVIVGGEHYADTAPVLRIFCIYALFLPTERFAGVALDSLNLPHKNLKKVLMMSSANIVGDLIAVFGVIHFFPQITQLQILMLVASVTILMTITGQIAGFNYLKKAIPLSYFYIFTAGKLFYTRDIKKHFRL
ncbi:MAG: hypothetical protein R6U19_04910 [Bacteroidales bacterium]